MVSMHYVFRSRTHAQLTREVVCNHTSIEDGMYASAIEGLGFRFSKVHLNQLSRTGVQH